MAESRAGRRAGRRSGAELSAQGRTREGRGICRSRQPRAGRRGSQTHRRLAAAGLSSYLGCMTGYDIKLERSGAHGRYVITLPDGLEAEMTFSREGDVMTIDHTGVPSQHEGKGIAAQLV